MITDAAFEQTEKKIAWPYAARVAVTVLALALVWLGHRVPLPFVDLGAELPPGATVNLTMMVLSLNPLFVGFLLVELFALLTSSGRRLRSSLVEGRARLNRAALVTGLLLTVVQAAGIAGYLKNFTGPSGLPAVADAGWGFFIITIVTLTAVTAALYVLANFLTDFGIGNGFALLILFEFSWPSFAVAMSKLSQLQDLGVAEFFGLLLAVVLVALVILLMRAADETWTPPLPQGILPVLWTLQLFALAFRVPFGLSRLGFELLGLLFSALGVVLLSWLGFHLFSSPARLRSSLREGDDVVVEVAEVLRRRLPIATALLVGGSTALLAWKAFEGETFAAVLDVRVIAIAVAAALDFRTQFRFLRRHGDAARLIQLDDVHFADSLAARLQEAEIDALTSAYRFRSLYFFLNPLVKIDVLVPREQLERAGEVLRSLEVAREVEVF